MKFTTAYVRFLGERKQGRLRIVVGRDARLSGEMVGDLIEGALLGCGADVVNVGLCTTPGVELAVTAHEADGGIIITASHNPRQWNALKLLDADGEFLSDAEGKRVLELAERSDFEFPEVDALGHVLRANRSTTNISVGCSPCRWSMSTPCGANASRWWSTPSTRWEAS